MNKRNVAFYYIGLFIFIIAYIPFTINLNKSFVDQATLNADGQAQNAQFNSTQNSTGYTSSGQDQNQGSSIADTVQNDSTMVSQDQFSMLIAGIFMAVGGIMALIGWTRTLIYLAQLQEWNWFFGILIVGVIVMYIYLKSNPQTVGNRTSTPSAPPSTTYHSPNSQPPSALEILQQRYARGEIDLATYKEMVSQLKASDTL